VNDQLKQRLVGAIVLVSLAVIFIPMILPGGGLSDAVKGRKVPPEPDYRFPQAKPTPKVPAISPPVIVPMSESEVKSSISEKKADKPATQNTTNNKDDSTNASIEKPVASTAGKTIDKKVDTRPGQVTAWIVQVGSFTSAPNAKALQDRLRKMGYASFVEAVKTNEGMNYRVRVGPELTRTLADKLQKHLEEKAKLKGVVQSYP